MGSHEIVLSTLDCKMEVALRLTNLELQFTLREPVAQDGLGSPLSDTLQTTIQTTIIGAMNVIGELQARGYRYAEELVRLLVRAMQVQLAI